MGVYSKMKKEFMFLRDEYGFKISSKQKSGSFYYIDWTNPNRNITIYYDCCDEENLPITVFVYDADEFPWDAVKYRKEFDQSSARTREQIHCAAEWVRKAIEDKIITI